MIGRAGEIEQTIEILARRRENNEAHHRCDIGDDALVAAARLSDRYIAEYRLPDKPIDLVDQAAANVRLRTGGRDDRAALEAEHERLLADKQAAVDAEQYEEAAQIKTHVDRRAARAAPCSLSGRRRAARASAPA